MSFKQYNFLMSSMLNQQWALTKLRAELEEREGRKCFSCRKFRYLACNYRNSIGEEKEKPISKNKFKVLVSQVMQCGVKGKVKVR